MLLSISCLTPRCRRDRRLTARRPAYGATMQNSWRVCGLLGPPRQGGTSTTPSGRRVDSGLEQNAVLGASAGLQRDDALDLTSWPHHASARRGRASTRRSWRRPPRPAAPHSAPRLVGPTPPQPASGVAGWRPRRGRIVRRRIGRGASVSSRRCLASVSYTGESATPPSAGRARGGGDRERTGREPDPAVSAPSSGTPVTTGRSATLHSAARSGRRGQAPMTTPTQVRARVRRASTVSAVWLSVPSAAVATTSTGASSPAAMSARVSGGSSATGPATRPALHEHEVVGGASSVPRRCRGRRHRGRPGSAGGRGRGAVRERASPPRYARTSRPISARSPHSAGPTPVSRA